MVAEEVKDPRKDIPKGYISALATLVALALGVMVVTGGITDWRKLSTLDYPLPEAIGIVLGKASGLTKIFASIGLFGLIASLHGTILASSRQVFAMARSGYLPKGLDNLNHRFKTPHWALVVAGAVSFIAIYIGTHTKNGTSQILVLSVLGAVVMYIMCMVSLFILRKKEPKLPRPFRAPVYPWFPGIALLITVVSLFAIIWFNFSVSIIFFTGLAAIGIVFTLMGKHKVALTEEMMATPD
jgi:ethanolamine permease